jgi:hypothetical protein
VEEVALKRLTCAALVLLIGMTAGNASDRLTTYLAAARALAESGPALEPDQAPPAGAVARLADGKARLDAGAVEAALDWQPGQGLRLVVMSHGRRELDLVLRATADLPRDGAALQIADIDRENATPEVLVTLIRDGHVRLLVATAKSDGPGWEIGPAVLDLADMSQATARDIDGDGLAELVVSDPKASALRLSQAIPVPVAVLTMRATAWFDAAGEPAAAPLHRARLASMVAALAPSDDVRAILCATLAGAARFKRLDELWNLARKLDLGGRATREAVTDTLRAAGYIPAETSLDPRRPGDRSR